VDFAPGDKVMQIENDYGGAVRSAAGVRYQNGFCEGPTSLTGPIAGALDQNADAS
jgi:hypothetical protein